uniref:Uncharacterized protein n=1 Tax=Anguilla anguilla TaxID=7936 RepID=A0A0E9TZX0_ANGAN
MSKNGEWIRLPNLRKFHLLNHLCKFFFLI